MKRYELWYTKEAPYGHEDFSMFRHGDRVPDDGWEKWSLPIGNGYMGVNIFGRTATERMQITENSLSNPCVYDPRYPGGDGGLNNFCEFYLDFGHPHDEVTDYKRSLSLNDAVARTEYVYRGVRYTREHFTSYPDRVFVTKIAADQKGALDMTVRPEIPYLSPYLMNEGDGMGKTGKVSVSGNMITFSGEMEFYKIQYEGQVAVLPEGGCLTAREKTVEIKGADSVLLLTAVGTNYKMERRVFLERDPKKKLSPYPHPHEKVTAIIENAMRFSYEALLQRHTEDYTALISRAEVDFGGEAPSVPTDALVYGYRNGRPNRYLEELYFTYGRYLLIASSRPDTYPANLQGTWNRYACAPWSAGYWHNINVQMNYWPAFNTNLCEMFLPYMKYFDSYRPVAEHYADLYVEQFFPENLTEKGTNGISIGTAAWLYRITGVATPPSGHSGPGTCAFTAKLFADYFAFSQDETYLRDVVYPANYGVAKLLSKTMEMQDDGTLLVKYSASPEQMHEGKYYWTKGCAFDQQMAYECYRDTVMLADRLGLEDGFIRRIRSDMEKLDPVQIGASGQIKEYREEEHYGDIGEYHHRHISHLVGLYPGTIINQNTPDRLHAAEYSLNERGDRSTGWSTAHKLNAWARLKNGKRAYDLLRMLLGKCTMPNLWDSHPPFQIDGNFGGTAGIAEMLVQSHEGYIHLLPALPEEWKNGSFTGLTARGGFTVSAKWRDGRVIRMEIVSAVGGHLKLLANSHFIECETEKGQRLTFVENENGFSVI
ncbi:MAG: glycoside hydrolase family 95 protein [Clostridia bacterium]|nr:glycoside hydrolase family 95 protein [Clostridia bacterium]